MNDELNKVLIDAIQKTQAGVGNAVDFAVEQAPDLIRQLLLWKSIDAAIGCLCALILLSLVCYFWYYAFFKAERPQKQGEETLFFEWSSYAKREELHVFIQVFGSFASLFFIPLCTVWFFECLSIIIKIYVAPKIYLIEYAASLIK